MLGPSLGILQPPLPLLSQPGQPKTSLNPTGSFPTGAEKETFRQQPWAMRKAVTLCPAFGLAQVGKDKLLFLSTDHPRDSLLKPSLMNGDNKKGDPERSWFSPLLIKWGLGNDDNTKVKTQFV